MRLTDLAAELKGTVNNGWLMLKCPVCKGDAAHWVRVAISDQPYHERSYRRDEVHSAVGAEYDAKYGKVKVWQASGTFPESLTLNPSINIVEVNEKGETLGTRCWHGWITNGDAT